MAAKQDRLMTPKEVAEHLGIAEQTLTNWRSQRTGPPYVVVGGRPRYRRAAVEKWLDEQTVTTY